MAQDDDFPAFYASVFARLVGQLRIVTGELQDAEDVVQEALARASMRWTRLRTYDAPEAWVRRVAMNLAADRARRGRRRLAALRRLGPPAPTPAVQVEDLALLEALRGLSIGQRQVLVLHYLVGMPQVTRHRLNRSGDRQLNRALHAVVVARLRDDPATRAYAARRAAESKSSRDIRRCLKRAVARQFVMLLERHDRPGVHVLRA